MAVTNSDGANIGGSRVARGRETTKNIEEKKDVISGAQDLFNKVITKEEEPQAAVSPELKNLIFLGRVIKEFEFDGYKLKMSTLSAPQRKKLIGALSVMTKDERWISTIPYTIAESIISINDAPIADLCDDDEVTDDLMRKVWVISQLQISLVAERS